MGIEILHRKRVGLFALLIIVILLVVVSFLYLPMRYLYRNEDAKNVPTKNMSRSSRDLLQALDSTVVFSALDPSGTYQIFLAKSSRVASKIHTPLGGDCITPVFAPDGSGILYSQHDGKDFELCYYDILKKKSRILTNNDVDDFHPSFNSDGTVIAWSQVQKMRRRLMNKTEILVSSWPDFGERRLTWDNMADCYPVFSSDSNYVIVESGSVNAKDMSGLFGLFMITMDGKRSPLYYDPSLSGNGIPHVFSDTVLFEGTVLLDQEGRNGLALDIFVTNLTHSGKRHRLTNWATRGNPSPRFSPDGKKIACYRNYNGGGRGSRIVILDFDGREARESLVIGSGGDEFRMPRWNRNGTLIVAEDLRRRGLMIADLNGHVDYLPNLGGYRTQRFLELYNFDVH